MSHGLGMSNRSHRSHRVNQRIVPPPLNGLRERAEVLQNRLTHLNELLQTHGRLRDTLNGKSRLTNLIVAIESI